MQSGSSAGARWWTLGAISAATFMLLLDISAVVTALPSIERDLGAGFVDLQWVVDAYTITLAAFVLTAGSLADRLGRRRVFAVGLGLFSAASLLVGLSPDPTFLNVARGMQGVGGAILFAVSLALLAHEFAPGAERARAMAAYGATLGIAVAVGPLVGGALTEALGWEWIFFINVPVGAATLAVTFTRLRESRDPDAGRTDWAGLATLSGGLFLLVLGLLRGNADGWGSPRSSRSSPGPRPCWRHSSRWSAGCPIRCCRSSSSGVRPSRGSRWRRSRSPARSSASTSI